MLPLSVSVDVLMTRLRKVTVVEPPVSEKPEPSDLKMSPVPPMVPLGIGNSRVPVVASKFACPSGLRDRPIPVSVVTVEGLSTTVVSKATESARVDAGVRNKSNAAHSTRAKPARGAPETGCHGVLSERRRARYRRRAGAWRGRQCRVWLVHRESAG